MSPRWLSALVRARQAQEDAAQQQLATARRHAETEQQRAADEQRKLQHLLDTVPDELTSSAYVAASASLQSAAAVYSAALFSAGQAELAVSGRRTDLHAAAITRSAAENLHERIEGAERVHAARAAQHALDEVGARMHRDREDER